MKVKIWGCRGSIPSPGKETVRYGGDTTCIEIRNSRNELTIIDAGSGLRRLGDSLMNENNILKMNLIFTHAHWDHLSGFPFFAPAYYSKYSISLCGGPIAQETVLQYLHHQMNPPYFPVNFSVLKADFPKGCSCDQNSCNHKIPGSDGSVKCESIPLNHPNGGYGFKLTENNQSFVFLTDNEIRFHHESGRERDEYIAFCKDASLLIHDAHYLESEYPKKISWGHSTYQDAINLAIDAGVKRLGIFHHDPARTDDEIDQQIKISRRQIAEQGSMLECFACADGMELLV